MEFLGAVAIAAGPGLGAVFVAAFGAVVGVLDFDQLEEFFPVGAFFVEGDLAEAAFDPFDLAVAEEAGGSHVVEVFVGGDGAAAEGAGFDGVEEGGFLAGFLLSR